MVANVKDHIRKERGSTVVINLKDDHIRDGRGSTVIGTKVTTYLVAEQMRGRTLIELAADVDGDIDGPGPAVTEGVVAVFCSLTRRLSDSRVVVRWSRSN